MEKINNETILQSLNWRYATKKFDSSKKISAQDWQTLEEALRLSPSSYGLQPWKFLVVQDAELRKKLTPVSWNQPQIEACSHFVVLTHLKEITEAYVKNFIQDVSKTRSVPLENLQGYQDMMIGDLVKGPRHETISHWAARQSYIAMGTFMTVAAMLKIDTCPMEGLDPIQYDEILGLKSGPYVTVAAVAAGYRSSEDQTQFAKKVRFEKNKVIQTL